MCFKFGLKRDTILWAELLQCKFGLHELKDFGAQFFTANCLSSLKIIHHKIFTQHLFSFGIYFHTGDISSISFFSVIIVSVIISMDCYGYKDLDQSINLQNTSEAM